MEEKQLQTEVDEQQTPAEAQNTETKEENPVDNRVPYDRFKKKVDEVNTLKAELEKIRKEQEEAERAKLEEQNEYKKLYEKAQEELAQLKAEALNARKDALLVQAGYTTEQIKVLRNSISGETDEELTKAIEELKAVIPPKPKYVDPTPMNGERQRPEPADPSEIGVKMFEKIKNKIF